ncbi:MAG: hypothetical protein JNM74_26160 [Myxococcales bacterium]|nr:hypothetical protein [Myxococcales bacterium]
MKERQTRDLAFSDPEADRERRLLAGAEALGSALAGASIAVVAAALGLSETDLRRMMRPSSGRLFAAADLAALPTACAASLAAHLLEGHNLAVVELPKPSRDACDLRLVANAQRESAEAVACALEAVGAGHLTRAQAATLERETNEAIAALLAVREVARVAMREGVVGLVREAPVPIETRRSA